MNFKKGDLISYIWAGEKKLGIFFAIKDSIQVYAYWQRSNGEKSFQFSPTWVGIDNVNKESSWSQINGFENIPKIAENRGFIW